MAAVGSTSRWWSPDTVAVVTGSNKGIGLAIVRGLAKQGVTTVLTARDETRGRTATSKLVAEGLPVGFHPLDVTSLDSIGTFASWLEKEFGGLDILINNAGINISAVSYENAKQILDTNFYGVKHVTQNFLPLLRPSLFGARVITISSGLGQLQCLRSQSLRNQLGNTGRFEEHVLESIARQYLEDVKSGATRKWAISYPQYSESKIFVNAYMRLLAKSLSSRPDGHKIYVNAVSPGYIATDMSGHSTSASPVEEGADTPVWLALLQESPTGQFFQRRAAIQF